MVIILKFGEPAGYLNNNFITSETTCNTFIINKWRDSPYPLFMDNNDFVDVVWLFLFISVYWWGG